MLATLAHPTSRRTIFQSAILARSFEGALPPRVSPDPRSQRAAATYGVLPAAKHSQNRPDPKTAGRPTEATKGPGRCVTRPGTASHTQHTRRATPPPIAGALAHERARPTGPPKRSDCRLPCLATLSTLSTANQSSDHHDNEPPGDCPETQTLKNGIDRPRRVQLSSSKRVWLPPGVFPTTKHGTRAG